MNTEKHVDEAMAGLQTTSDDVITIPLATDTMEEQLVSEFMVSRCSKAKENRVSSNSLPRSMLLP